MATPEEVRQRWDSMDGPQHLQFIVAYGGYYGEAPPGKGLDYYLEELHRHPEREATLCYLLGLPTEQQKMVRAAVDAAEAAKTSAAAAAESVALVRQSNRTAVLATWAAIVSAIAASAALFWR